MAFVARLAVAAGLGVFGLACDESAPEPLTDALSVSVGSAHACVALRGGAAACWGGNSLGATGAPVDSVSSGRPAIVAGLAGLASLSAGDNHTCALGNDGAVACWGANTSAELGNGAKLASLAGSEADNLYDPTPTIVSGLPRPATEIYSGGKSDTRHGAMNAYSCARLDDGSVACWGRDVFGLSPTPALAITPTVMTKLGPVRVASFQGDFGCAIVEDGSVVCWGNGPLGQSDPLLPADLSMPVPVLGLAGAVGIAVGAEQACALLDDRTVHCWGGLSLQRSPTPVAVPGLGGVTAIAAGGFDMCALLGDGSVSCWGATYGLDAPGPIRGVSHAISMSVGGQSACAVIDDGTVRCWGVNAQGELGDGTTTDEPPPTTQTTTRAVTVVRVAATATAL